MERRKRRDAGGVKADASGGQVERRRQEEEENWSLIGSAATIMESRNSTLKRRSYLFIIGDYLYKKG